MCSSTFNVTVVAAISSSVHIFLKQLLALGTVGTEPCSLPCLVRHMPHASNNIQVRDCHIRLSYDSFNKLYGNVLFVTFVSTEKGPVGVPGKATRYGLDGS